MIFLWIKTSNYAYERGLCLQSLFAAYGGSSLRIRHKLIKIKPVWNHRNFLTVISKTDVNYLSCFRTTLDVSRNPVRKNRTCFNNAQSGSFIMFRRQITVADTPSRSFNSHQSGRQSPYEIRMVHPRMNDIMPKFR